LPAPRRSTKAYRLYSDRDVELIRRVRELCETGMAPSEAARSVLAAADAAGEAARLEADADALAVQQILDAVDRFDPDRIDAAVRSALFLGPAVTLFERVYGPALVQIGERWAAGGLDVAHEHLASEIVHGALRLLLGLAQPRRPRLRVVLACFADEEHTGPLYGVALRLAGWNIQARILGARTPPEAVRCSIDALRPDLVGLSVTVAPPPARARTLVHAYAAACGATPWIVGGRAAPALRELLAERGAHLAAPGVDPLHDLIHRLCPVEPLALDL
jgi:methanogenic corrinoid protein MtbC1